MSRFRRGEAGFTLIELLVVMIIIGILAAIAIPIMVKQRQRAIEAGLKTDLRAIEAGLKTDLRAIAEAQETYYTDHENYLAIASTPDPEIIDHISLSSGNSVSVTLNAGGTAYCVSASNPRTTRAWIFVSSQGGQQPSSVTACPASF